MYNITIYIIYIIYIYIHIVYHRVHPFKQSDFHCWSFLATSCLWNRYEKNNIAWNLVAHEAAVPERPMVPLDPLGMVLRDGFAAKFTKDQPVLSPWFPSFPWFFDCRCWWYVMVCPYLSMMKPLSLLVEQNKCKRSPCVPDCSSAWFETPSVIPAIDILRGRRVFLMPLRWFCRAWRLERGWFFSHN